MSLKSTLSNPGIFARIFSAYDKQKNKNTQPGPEKQYSLQNRAVLTKDKMNVLFLFFFNFFYLSIYLFGVF